MSADTKTGLQLRSLIKNSGELELSLANVPIPEPGPDEVVVRVEASPINPSDLGLLVGAADLSTARTSGTTEAPIVTAKQVYIYGSLDTGQVILDRSFGMAWGVGGWLLSLFLQKIGPVEAARLRQRVVDELKTTFASHYTREVSLQEALLPSNIAVYGKRATGEKFLINPNKAG